LSTLIIELLMQGHRDQSWVKGSVGRSSEVGGQQRGEVSSGLVKEPHQRGRRSKKSYRKHIQSGNYRGSERESEICLRDPAAAEPT